MKPFDLLEPATLEEAVTLLDANDESVRALGGGTALMLMMKTRLFQPTRLVSLHRLHGDLRRVQADDQGNLHIGALTTLAQLEHSKLLASAAPVVSRALRTLANVRIRNVATIGGHLAHGDPHMDLPPVLLTLGAQVRAVSPRAERWIKAADLFVGYYQTALSRDELIAEVVMPAQPADVLTAYEKFTALNADDWPSVGVAVWYRMNGGVLAEARIAISAATERPVRVPEAEMILAGAPAVRDSFVKAADAAAQAIEPLDDIRGSASYKREMVRVHVRRALEHALEISQKFQPREAQ
jgi:carbon-monoxide dehydrogenase medium subunit